MGRQGVWRVSGGMESREDGRIRSWKDKGSALQVQGSFDAISPNNSRCRSIIE
jgi:hypothetical protein